MNTAKYLRNSPTVGSSLQITFNSRHAAVSGIVQSVVDFVTGSRTNTAPNLYVVLDELISNAIEHGNKGDAGKCVRVVATVHGEAIASFSVSDEGPGFDFQVWMERDGPVRGTARGLMLVHALCDSVSYGQNGSQVSFTMDWSGSSGSDESGKG